MLIDLTVPLNEKTPTYPGDPKTKIEKGGVLEKDGFTDHYLSVGTHVGTHIDAPLHMVNGKTLDQFRVDKFVGRGVYVDVRSGFDLSEIKSKDIQEGDIVLFNTGMIKHYHNKEYYEKYEAIPEEVANYLVERKVSMVGMDMSGPDHDPFPIHKILLSNEVLIIENLCNLEKLAGKECTVYALPIKLEVDGAPARVIAETK